MGNDDCAPVSLSIISRFRTRMKILFTFFILQTRKRWGVPIYRLEHPTVEEMVCYLVVSLTVIVMIVVITVMPVVAILVVVPIVPTSLVVVRLRLQQVSQVTQ